MTLRIRRRILPWLIAPLGLGLLALGLWWDGPGSVRTGEQDSITQPARRSRLSAPAHARIPEHSAYQALVPRKSAATADDEGAAANGNGKVAERIHQIRQQRGGELAPAERKLALEFLAGKVSVAGLEPSAIHWLADEVLTSLRLQQPPQPGLAKALAEAAANPLTDPVIRDYVVQHLGHLWEQGGFDPQIADALWAAVDSADDTTPGSALIALRGGFSRERDAGQLEQVHAKALALAASPETPLAARATALGIAGESGSPEVTALAKRLLGREDTPVILKRIAGTIVRNGSTLAPGPGLR